MIKKLVNWFEEVTRQEAESGQGSSREVATAVLLYELMRADGELNVQEQEAYEQVLRTHFSLDESQLSDLLVLTKDKAAEAVDFSQFTRIINDGSSLGQKRGIIDGLWKIAYADDVLDPEEEHLIRRIADLLYVPHSLFIQSKLAASGQL
ncbi:TerB family tellurite resistance protein [Paraglaciecola sp. L1A13]|uniref:tellurite resistance TerB family protein n=1 Tax=Paraglaciecola sp. L1A13 TaxID=2686359 RepID=UPI00131C6896|nr:TerB family tellurite resistance protein [Paraglaciecola sp. L1A13]|tara:strand:- start:246 stop:695 length:450 start_codon:yes stop_codon:yes gene_type:complete